MRKTKIICTLGPASSDETTIKKLIAAGMDVARFNFSHGEHKNHLELYQLVDKIRTELQKPIGTMLDTKGPEIRLGVFEDGKVTLAAGDIFHLICEKATGTQSGVSITYEGLCSDVGPGNTILIDDGLVELTVEKIEGTHIVCRVVNGGTISNRKGVNVPDVSLSMPYISPKDHEDIVFAAQHKYNFIAASFVSQASDILEIRKILAENGGSQIKIVSKIENLEGVKNIDEILRVSDGIMVARGDMGVEIPLEDVPVYQKVLIKKAYEAGKPVITATQMLESMIKNPRPTRAETNDIANAIYDSTSAIMLSGESAAGAYPVEAVKTMATIATRIEKDIDYKSRFAKNKNYIEADVTNAISRATCSTAHSLDASAIITVTKSGHTARMCSRFRPETPIIACTPDLNIYQQLSMSWGVHPLLMESVSNTDELFTSAEESALKAGYISDGDILVITAGVPVGVPGTTNILKVQVVGDVLVTGNGLNNFSTVGNLCVVKDANEALIKLKQNDILVIPEIDVNIIPLLENCLGLITSAQNVPAMAETIATKYKIPLIVNAANCTNVLKSGTAVVADAKNGQVCNAAAYKKSK